MLALVTCHIFPPSIWYGKKWIPGTWLPGWQLAVFQSPRLHECGPADAHGNAQPFCMDKCIFRKKRLFCNLVPTLAQQRPTQTTKSTKMAQHKPDHSPQWPNISPRSGKHRRVAWTKIQPHWNAQIQNKGRHRPQNSPRWLNMSPIWCFLLGIYGIFCKRVAWTKIQRHWNAQIQDKGWHISQNSPRWPNMSPRWCQYSPKCHNIAQNGPR